MNTDNKTAKWHISYLNKIARELRALARKEAKGSGFEPLFDKGNSFSVGINGEGQPYVQINYTINGSTQCSNCAI
jgi:hypothetical protein